MVLMARRRNTSEVTGWGYYLSALLNDRHFDNLGQFAAEIEAHRYHLKPRLAGEREGSVVSSFDHLDEISIAASRRGVERCVTEEEDEEV